MRKKRGSAAVLALVFLLFLSLAGGAWVTMLAHENATAMTDEKDQQAWYAAEAGMKRAKAEIVEKTSQNDFKKWLTEDKKFPNKGTTIAVKDGQKPGKEDEARYAVYIGYGDKNLYDDEMASGKQEYNIISVGYYMDSTKIINDNLITGNSSGGGGGETSKPALGNNIVTATGTVTVENSSTGNINGFFSGNKGVFDGTGGKFVSSNPNTGITTYTGKFLTKMPDELFVKDHYTYDGGELSGKDWEYTLEANKTYFIDLGTATVPNNFTINATHAAGCTLVIAGEGSQGFKFYGPTSGVPATIVVLKESASLGMVTNSGIRLRLLAAGDLTLKSNSDGFSGYGMFLSNGKMTIRTPINQAYLSVNGNLWLDNQGCSSFTGQALVSGDSLLGAGYLQYKTDVLDDGEFKLPDGMTAP